MLLAQKKKSCKAKTMIEYGTVGMTDGHGLQTSKEQDHENN